MASYYFPLYLHDVKKFLYILYLWYDDIDLGQMGGRCRERSITTIREDGGKWS